MDSGIIGLLSVLGALVSEDWGGPYYPQSRDRSIERYWSDTPYQGRRVLWLGTEGKMLWVPARYLVPIDGNIFYGDKIRELAGLVRSSSQDDPLPLRAAYGMATVIGPLDVAESIQYDDMRTWTTGDEDLDAWLADPESWLDEYAADDEHRAELQAEMEDELDEAVENNAGDLGKVSFQVRDGNHRVFGSLLGGEEGAWVLLADNQHQEVLAGRDLDAPKLIEMLE